MKHAIDRYGRRSIEFGALDNDGMNIEFARLYSAAFGGAIACRG
jgi:hypothetical protein